MSEKPIRRSSEFPEECRGDRRCRVDREPRRHRRRATASRPARSATAPVAPREVDPGGQRRGPDDRPARRRLHGRRHQDARTSSTSPPIPARAFAASTSRSSTTAATRRRSSSPAATKSRRSRWRTATSRPRASRWPCCATARSACSTRRWRSTTPTATACRSTSWPATRSMRRCGGPASSGRTACRTRRPWCATTSSGTTSRSRCRTSPNRRCAPTRSR